MLPQPHTTICTTHKYTHTNAKTQYKFTQIRTHSYPSLCHVLGTTTNRSSHFRAHSGATEGWILLLQGSLQREHIFSKLIRGDCDKPLFWVKVRLYRPRTSPEKVTFILKVCVCVCACDNTRVCSMCMHLDAYTL